MGGGAPGVRRARAGGVAGAITTRLSGTNGLTCLTWSHGATLGMILRVEYFILLSSSSPNSQEFCLVTKICAVIKVSLNSSLGF